MWHKHPKEDVQNHKGTETIACLFGCELCKLHFLKLDIDFLDIYVNYVSDLPPDDLVQLLKMTLHIRFVKYYYSSTNCFSNVQWIFSEFQLNSYAIFLFLLLCSLCYCVFGVSVESLGVCGGLSLQILPVYLLVAKNWLSFTSFSLKPHLQDSVLHRNQE